MICTCIRINNLIERFQSENNVYISIVLLSEKQEHEEFLLSKQNHYVM